MTAPRILPSLTDVNRPFWTGGRDGHLMIERCDSCEQWQHPPHGACQSCGGSVRPEPASGAGTVFSFTVNHQQYHPEVPPPYVIAIVELVEQTDLRIPTNLVDCDPDDVAIGQSVAARFEEHGEVFVPVFAPSEES